MCCFLLMRQTLAVPLFPFSFPIPTHPACLLILPELS